MLRREEAGRDHAGGGFRHASARRWYCGFYLDLSAEETATTMGISPSSVRSATHRALASLGRMLQEQS